MLDTHSDALSCMYLASTLDCLSNEIHDSGVFHSMLVGHNSSTGKKRTREDHFLHREAITGSNKGVEVHSTEAIFGTSLPLAVHLFSLPHRYREGERESESKGLTVSEVSSISFLPACHFSLQYCIVYFLQMWAEKGETNRSNLN